MNSNDIFIVETFNSGLENLKIYIDGRFEKVGTQIENVKAQVQTLDKSVAVNTAKIEMLSHTFYWGFAILAIVVALVPYFYKERKEEKQQKEEKSQNILSKQEVQDMINSSITRTVDEAVAKALRNLGAFDK